ncbi:hypothetical protein DICPUDRAFT_54015 [Dictyostelium purpureum]|uniref:Tyrosine decarboxylase n=1 Tax=Dictyostelium purpureum TaxID=5786 RepID=F0ZF77_DICPU|nr:uncharacterized protein DICPUDRAFT_54015 [Dictyostelium purpureum]EGC37404.1 hypothetical protein DICPUDRAFT_54015 [Dictyostelium purpureum]|eukprot:XP_003286057.1 hypothetical protein DICPUDRAFT_54015 [Dictyostelium purpureum]
MKKKTESICCFLKKSVPFSSLRYQGHMNSDVLIPGIVGFISAMIYNQNNCCYKGSPTTSYIEKAVVNDLNRMVGFRFGDKIDMLLSKKERLKKEKNLITPFGHIASGGTISNCEALWSSFWVKFIPLALKEAIKNESILKNAELVNVLLPNGSKRKLLTLDAWSTVNISCDECVRLPYKVAYKYNVDHSLVMSLLKKYHPSDMGLVDFFNTHGLRSPVFLAPITCHYSIPKSIALLGLGFKSLITIAVDNNTRMDLDCLENTLETCIANKTPVINVVPILGTTEESSVDDLEGIVGIKKKMNNLYNFDFSIHCDGAFGCYFASCIRKDYPIDDPETDVISPSNCHLDYKVEPYDDFNKLDPQNYLSDYLIRQLKALPLVDTIVADPHKTGYIQYPAGAILYRNGKFKDVLSYRGSYIMESSEQNINTGVYCIEGSRPGAAAAAVYLAHSVVRTSKSGYGMILKNSMLNSKIFYLHLVWLASSNDGFIVTTVNKPDEELLKKIKERIFREGEFIDTDEIAQDSELVKLLSNVGADLNVLAYTFNFRNKDGTINDDYDSFIAFNKKINDRFDYSPEQNLEEFDFVVSSTSFGPSYGTTAINLMKRCGIDKFPDDFEVPLVRSAIMDIFSSQSIKNSVFTKIMNILKSELNRFSKEMTNY